MFRLSGIFSILFAIFFGALLFWTSQSVQRAEKRLSEISRYHINEESSLKVLSAEWDYLNRPQRLEKLAQDNFDLDSKVVGGSIIDDVNIIPEPVIPAIPKTKPKNLLQYVSTKKKQSTTSLKSQVIRNADRQDFDRFLNDIATGGQP